MKKLALACIGVLITMSVLSLPALAGEKVVKRVPAGAVAFHFVADLTIATGELVGYIAFIEGVDGDLDGDLFAGPPSEDTAYFTVRLTKPTPPPTFLPVETGAPLVVLLLRQAPRLQCSSVTPLALETGTFQTRSPKVCRLQCSRSPRS